VVASNIGVGLLKPGKCPLLHGQVCFHVMVGGRWLSCPNQSAITLMSTLIAVGSSPLCAESYVVKCGDWIMLRCPWRPFLRNAKRFATLSLVITSPSRLGSSAEVGSSCGFSFSQARISLAVERHNGTSAACVPCHADAHRLRYQALRPLRVHR